MKRLNAKLATMSLALSAVWSAAEAQRAEPRTSDRNTHPVRISGFNVGTIPEWSLDLGADTTNKRLRIVGALRLRNGIVFAEEISRQLFFYSMDRRLVRVVPLQSASRSSVRIHALQRVIGDTIAVLGLRSGWVVKASDSVATSISFADDQPPPSGSISILLAVFPNGSSSWGVQDRSRQIDPPAKRFTDSLDLILQSPARELRRIERTPAMMLGTDSAGRTTQMWFYPHFASAAFQDVFYYGFGDDYLVTKRNLLTGEKDSWRRAWAPSKVTSKDIDEFIDGWSVTWNKGSDSSAVKAAMRNAPFAEFVPAFSQFLVSTAGDVWVRNPNLIDAQLAGELNQTPLRASTWSVFDIKGQWLTDVSLPAGFQPTDIGSNYILGVQYRIANGALKPREKSVVVYKYSRLF